MIYADANATYPVNPLHFDDVAQLLKKTDGNPSSIHAPGRNAKVALEEARSQVARMLGARGSDVIFTSGATEANNMAIQGVINRESRQNSSSLKLPHIVITSVEHKAVLDPVTMMAERGLCKLHVAPVKSTGEIDTNEFLSLITPDTALVCLMHANNEIGTIFPVEELAHHIKAKAPKAHVHVDAVQMLGKADLSWYAKSPIDSAAFSGHKIGAFKGIGALYLKSGCKLGMLMAGGGQERGRRPGTENIPGILSFGMRCKELCGMEKQVAHSMQLVRDAFKQALKSVPGANIHGNTSEMLPNTIHFHIDGIPGDDILLNLDLAGIHASSGSACSSGSARPSHVVLAMGYSEWVALNSVRISFTAQNTLDDIAPIMKVIDEVVSRGEKKSGHI